MTTEITAVYTEGLGGLFIGLGIACYYSWPMVAAMICVIPFMILGSKAGQRVKLKQWGMMLNAGDKEQKEA